MMISALNTRRIVKLSMAAAMTSVALVGCGHSDDKAASQPPFDGYNLDKDVNPGVTPIDRVEFQSRLRSESSAFIRNIFSGGKLNNPVKGAALNANVSRLAILNGNSSSFTSCAQSRIAEHPEVSGSTSVNRQYALDLTSACDRVKNEDDKKDNISAISNSIQFASLLSCDGEFISSAEGLKSCKGVTDVTAETSGVFSGSFMASTQSNAKVSFFGTAPEEKEKVVKIEHRFSAIKIHNEGRPCQVMKNGRVTMLGACTIEAHLYSFTGTPEEKLNSPTDSGETVKPLVTHYVYELSGMELRDGDSQFSNGTVKIKMNNWDGTLTYQGTAERLPRLSGKSGDDEIIEQNFEF